MADLYNTDLGGNTRRALPTSRFGTRNLVWYSFFVDYDLLHGELDDNYTAYDASDSFYTFIVLKIQEAGELYHLGAPTNLSENGFIFAIADNDAREQDDGNSYAVAYGVEGDYTKSSVYQALFQALGSEGYWALDACLDQGYGIIAEGGP
jgi:hypothetical protein